MSDAKQLIASVRAALRDLESKVALSDSTRNQIREELFEIGGQLADLILELDPVRMPQRVFDPSHPTATSNVMALALIAQDRAPLADLTEFYGGGVYAIYYSGTYDLYRPLARTETPIYVGKADPDKTATNDLRSHGTKLFSRLSEHRKNIKKASTSLSIDDFECRYLVMQPGYQTAAESALISLFRPIWNKETRLVYGIGKHGDSAETRKNKRSPWDTLHAGRAWADRTSEDQAEEKTLRLKVINHFNSHPPISTRDECIELLIQGLTQ